MGFSLAEAFVELKARGSDTVRSGIDSIRRVMDALPSTAQSAQTAINQINASSAVRTGRAIGSTITPSLNNAAAAARSLASTLPGLSSVMGSTGAATRRLAGDARTLEAEFRRATSSANGGITTFGLIASSLAAGGIARLLSGAYSAARGMVVLGSEMEQARVDMTGLLGTTERADALLGQLRDLAAKTPLATKTITPLANQLLQAGVAAGDVTDTIRQFGDVTGGSTERMKQMSLAFSQAIQKGRLTGEELRQMTEAGFNPLNEIAKKTGKTVAQIMQEMSSPNSGGVPIEQLVDAFRSATAEGGKFYGRMIAQGNTVYGAFSQLSDALGLVFGGATEKLMRQLNLAGIMNSAADYVLTFKAQVEGAFASVGSTVNSVVQFFAKLFNTDEQKVYRQSLFDLGAQLWDLGGVTIKAVGDAAMWMWQALGGQQWYSWYMKSITGVVTSITETISYVTSLVANWDIGWQIIGESTRLFAINAYTTVENLFKYFGTLGDWLSSNWGNVFYSLAEIVLGAFENIGENVRSIWKSVTNFMATGEWVAPSLVALNDGIRTQFGEIPQLVNSGLLATTEKLDKLNQQLVDREAERRRKLNETLGNTLGTSLANLETGSPGGTGAAKQQVKPEFIGFAELSRKIQGSISPQEKVAINQLDEAKKQTQQNESMISQGDKLIKIIDTKLGGGALVPAYQ